MDVYRRESVERQWLQNGWKYVECIASCNENEGAGSKQMKETKCVGVFDPAEVAVQTSLPFLWHKSAVLPSDCVIATILYLAVLSVVN